MNETQINFLKLSLEDREKDFFQRFPDATRLQQILLGLGGQLVIWMPEDPHLSLLLEKGQSFEVSKRKKVKGEINRCHDNVVKLFLEKDIHIVSGYALSKDRWIQHSWGFDGKRIVETTCLFGTYYGAILSGLEITKFVISQLGNQIMTLPRKQLIKIPLPANIDELTGRTP